MECSSARRRKRGRLAHLTNQEFLGVQTESAPAVEGEPLPAGGHQDVGHVIESSGRGRDGLLDRRIMYHNDRKLLAGFQVSSC
jgi:hypothetical protein